MMKLQKLTLGPASRSNPEYKRVLEDQMQKMIRGGYGGGSSGLCWKVPCVCGQNPGGACWPEPGNCPFSCCCEWTTTADFYGYSYRDTDCGKMD